jgi:hypothetical protein
MKSGAVAAVLVLLYLYVAQCSEVVPSTTTTTASARVGASGFDTIERVRGLGRPRFVM